MYNDNGNTILYYEGEWYEEGTLEIGGLDDGEPLDEAELEKVEKEKHKSRGQSREDEHGGEDRDSPEYYRRRAAERTMELLKYSDVAQSTCKNELKKEEEDD